MMIFDMSTSYFHKISFHYFEYYLIMKLSLGYGITVRVHYRLSRVLSTVVSQATEQPTRNTLKV